VIVPNTRTAAYAAYAVDRTLMLAEWSLDPQSGATRPPMVLGDVLRNYFTINGKSCPATEPINVKPGQKVLLRLIGAGQFIHPFTCTEPPSPCSPNTGTHSRCRTKPT